MKRLLFFLLSLLLVLPLLTPAALAESDPIYDLVLDSQGVYVVNTETDTPVYEKSQDARMFPASTTKIMTALIVLELCQDPKNETVTCPDTEMFRYIIQDGGVNMQLVKGEVLSVYDLLLGLMMNSFCDAADLLAWHFGGGSVSAFVDKMNQKAEALKLENTHFVNAHGLHDPQHYSSPKDIATFFREALKHPLFREIISTRNYTIPANDHHRERKLQYTVSIYYESNSLFLDAYVGGKSGFTDQAGRCLATYSEKDGVSFISVLLGANMDSSRHYSDNMSWLETHTLISYVYENYQIATVLEEGQQIATLPVTDADATVPVISPEKVQILTLKTKTPSFQVQLPQSLNVNEIHAFQEIGSATLYFGEEATGRHFPLILNWDGTPIPTRSVLEKGAQTAKDSVEGIFENDKVFTTLLILLLVVIGISLPALKVSQLLHEKKSHRPKH